jgi:hypothetical protein
MTELAMRSSGLAVREHATTLPPQELHPQAKPLNIKVMSHERIRLLFDAWGGKQRRQKPS